MCFVYINSMGQILACYFMLHCVTLCFIVFHDCVGRSVSGGSGWIPSWFVQSLPTFTELSQKLCDHLTTSPVWGTSTPWNELVPNIWEHLGCTCLESHSKKSKVVEGDGSNRGHSWKQNVCVLLVKVLSIHSLVPRLTRTKAQIHLRNFNVCVPEWGSLGTRLLNSEVG